MAQIRFFTTGRIRMNVGLWALLLMVSSVQAAEKQAAVEPRLLRHLEALNSSLARLTGIERAKAHATLAVLEHQADRPQQAREHLYMIRGLAAEADNTDADPYRLALVRAQIGMEAFVDAEHSLQQIDGEGWEAQQLQSALVVAAAKAGQWKLAQRFARAFAPSASRRAQLYGEMAVAYAEAGHTAEAKQFMDQVFDLLPLYQKLPTYLAIALADHAQGDTETARAALKRQHASLATEKVASKTPPTSMAVQLAVAWYQTGDTEQAAALLTEAFEDLQALEGDRYARAATDVAMGWTQLNDHARAAQLLDEAAASVRSTHVARQMMEAYLAAREVDRAAGLAEKYNITLSQEQAYLALAESHLTHNELDAVAQIITQFNPSSVRRLGVIIELARAYNEQRQFAAFDAWLATFDQAHERAAIHRSAAEGLVSRP